ncbi:MAG: homocysteine S-methyltransferase family protein [Tannerella sp.]|jgi:5-methyltetrahydrofolate--homocysteine methyltransferase|nr:homocysteine S-methyltransferase family protein [Tannerella sp.]
MKITEILRTGKILLSDGAWGTFLYNKGLQPGDCPDEWTLSHPGDVEAIAASYIAAGSDMVETNSFGANRYKLEHYGLQNKVAEINRQAAQLSRHAAGNDRFVLGSVGQTGKMLMMGDITEDDMYECYKEQIVALEEGGADAVCIETMTDADEAAIAILAAKDNTDLEVICTFTFDRTGEHEYHTMMGLTPTEAARRALEAGADIIGTNCGNGIEQMIDIVNDIKQSYHNALILVHANAGLPELRDGKNFFPETPEMMASFVPKLIKAGANIIGGCCGTTPEHIAAIGKALCSVNF